MSKLFNQKFILSFSILVLITFCLYPFIILIGKVIFSGADGAFNLHYVQKAFLSKSTFKAITNTIWVSLASALFSTLLAIPLSWVLTRTNLPKAGVWRSLFCLPYAIPPYIGAIAWIYLANPSNGLINELFGVKLFNIYSSGGLIWVMGSFFYTFILLSLSSALDRMDPSLEEAARLSGAGPFRIFFQITLPIVWPSLMSGVLLVILAAAASFGVPALIGNPAGIYLMTTKIYTYQKMGSLSGIYQSGAISIVLLILAIIILVVNQKILSRDHFKTVSGKTSRHSLIDLGKWKGVISFFLSLFIFILFILPILGIAFTALSKIQGKFELSNLGFQNFYKVFFEVNETPRAFRNSLVLAFVVATVATFFGMIMSYINVKTRIKGRSLIEIFASLPYATPGTVLALAFILSFSGGIWGVKIALYNTLFMIGLAYFAKYLNFAIRTTGDGFGQIDDCLSEAARVSGASWGTTLTTIWFPLMKPALVASWFLIFMPAFSELTMTILLTGPGLETMGTLLFQLQEYGDASGGGAAVLSLTVIVAVGIINIFVKILSKGKYGL